MIFGLHYICHLTQLQISMLKKTSLIKSYLLHHYFRELFLRRNLSVQLLSATILYTPGPNKLSWRHLKCITKNKIYLKNIINITNMCLKLSHWPSYFKTSMTIIIPKPNNVSYDFPKLFRPIILLNILEKLIKKSLVINYSFTWF